MFTLNLTYTFMNPNHKPFKVPDREQSEQSWMGELWFVNAQVAFLQFKHLNSLQLHQPDSKKSHLSAPASKLLCKWFMELY